MKIDNALFAALAHGFISGCGEDLAAEEKRLMHVAPRVLTWCQALRFLSDYLNGDTYYKTDYDEHNLHRTRVQLALLKSMEDNSASMERAVLEAHHF